MYVCLIILQQSHDSETWIKFFRRFLNATSKKRKIHVFLDFERNVRTYSRIYKLMLLPFLLLCCCQTLNAEQQEE